MAPMLRVGLWRKGECLVVAVVVVVVVPADEGESAALLLPDKVGEDRADFIIAGVVCALEWDGVSRDVTRVVRGGVIAEVVVVMLMLAPERSVESSA